MRINHQDFVLHHNENTKNIFYTMSGDEDEFDAAGNPIIKDESSDKIFAKAIYGRKSRDMKSVTGLNKVSYRYYILMNPEKMPYNPKKNFSVTDQNPLSFVESKCKDGWSFEEVPQNIFDKYLNFLRTQNIKWLKETHRELK